MKKSKVLSIVLSLALVCTSTNVSSRVFAAGEQITKSITLNVKSEHKMYVGTSKKITVKSVTPKKSSRKVAFKSDTSSVVKIDKNGTMKALKAGSAKITVTSASNKKVKKKVKVTVKNLVKNSSDNRIELPLNGEKTIQLSGSLQVSDLKFSSSDKAVATVSAKGVIKGKKAGTAKVTVMGEKGAAKGAKQVISIYVVEETEEVETPETEKTDVPTTKVSETEKPDAVITGNPEIEKTDVPTTKVPETGKPDVITTAAPITEKPEVIATALITEKPDVITTTVPETGKPDVITTTAPITEKPEVIATAPITEKPDVITTAAPITEKPDVSATKVPETEKTNVPTTKNPGNATSTVESITFDRTEITLSHGEWAGLVMTVNPGNVKCEDIVVSSENTAIATAVNQGLNSKGEMIAGVVAGYPGVIHVTATVGGKTAVCTVTVVEKEIEADFAVPYIATRYFTSLTSNTENVVIPYYMTDSKHSDYVKNDTSKKMNLIYEVDNQVHKQENIFLGEQELNLGKLSAGEHSIGIQAEDPATGKRSHRVYVEIKVVDGTENSCEVPEKSLAIKGDITEQLNSIMADKAKEGRTKIILPKDGSYTIDGTDGGLKIPSGITLDLNGSTINMKASKGASAAIVTMDNVQDAHITGGTLSGDKGQTGSSGAVAVRIIGSKYCSITNIKIENISGNAFVTERTESTFSRLIADNEFKREISKNNGKSTITHTPLIDVTELKEKYGYVMIGCNDYQKVVRAEFGMIYINFYDSNKQLISTVEGYQHRRTKIPENAQYAQAKVLGGLEGIDRIRFYYNELCENLEIKNVQFENIAKNAIMPTTFNHLLVEDCTFTGVSGRVAYIDEGGQSGAGGGWTEAQDLYYRNNTVTDGYKEVYFNTGRNLYLENLKGQNIRFEKGVLGGIIRDMNDSGMNINWTFGPFCVSGYARISDNTCKNINVKHIPNDKVFQPLPNYRIKNCTIAGDSFSSSPEYVEYVNCTFTNFNGDVGILRGCILNEGAKVGEDITIYSE